MEMARLTLVQLWLKESLTRISHMTAGGNLSQTLLIISMKHEEGSIKNKI